MGETTKMYGIGSSEQRRIGSRHRSSVAIAAFIVSRAPSHYGCYSVALGEIVDPDFESDRSVIDLYLDVLF